MTRWTPEQEQAIYKSGSNIIVSAGAGSGKTAVLSERVLKKIESGIHINELLILTFTKAAASEMKYRIRKKLSNDEKYRDEVNLISSSYITTFDSFALSVVKKYHYLLNISSDISISDESIVLLKEREILDQIFEEYYDSHDSEFEELISSFCVKNDKSLRNNVFKIANQINNNIKKYEYISFIRNNFFESDNITKILKDYEEFINNKKKVIRLEVENLNYYFDSSYVDKVNECINSIMNSDYSELYKFDKISLPRIPNGSDEEGKRIKEHIKELLDDLVSFNKYGSISDIESNILLSKTSINKILDIVEEYIERLKLYKKENNIYTFSDIAELAIKVLKDNKSALDELKYSFKEIMIDEYQDTNDIQDIFIGLIENNNVYMVGDIKQSIYKFRGSNPDLFRLKYDNYSNNNGGVKIDLIKNFRSREEVINNINRIFELLMDNYIGGAEYRVSHEMVYGNTDYDDKRIDDFNYNTCILEYNNENKEYSNNEIEIFTIASDIKNKINSGFKVYDKESRSLRPSTYNDYVIILDRSKYFNDYKKVFEYMGIPLTILRDDNLTNSIDLLLIRNIFDFIYRINNNDFNVDFKYDFMSIARSFLYEYSDSFIFDTIRCESYKETDLYRDFESIKDVNSKTIETLFNEVLDVSNYYEKIYKVGDYENINVRLTTLYNITCNLNKMGYGIIDFVKYIDSIIENEINVKYDAYSTSSDSVKIITIHGSKGLEYPVCYFADLNHNFNTSDIKDKFIVSNEYGLIIPYNDNSILKDLYKSKYMKDEISERLRLFYVALTRAREKAIIVLPYKDTRKLEKNDSGVIDEIRRLDFTKLSDFVYGVKDYLSEYFSEVDLNSINLTKNYLFKKDIKKDLDIVDSSLEVEEININSNTIESKHFSKESSHILSKKEYDVMKFGTKIHQIFEYIDFKNYDESIISDKYIRGKVNSFVNSDLLSNIKISNVYKEYEFMYEKDNIKYNGVIDLMLEYDDHIDIIDYKLKNISDEKYIDQLNGYKKYIEMISNKKVNTYLYSILDERYDII